MSNEVEQIITSKGLTGFKSLAISQNATLLLSMYNFVWEPGRSVISHCKNCGNTPQRECTCGIYAHGRLDMHLRSGYIQNEQVIVELAMWGVIHQFTYGYRSQYAKITKIFIPRVNETIPLAARRDSLELNYMVPVEFIDLPTKVIDGQVTPRATRISIEDYEMFQYADDESIRNFCRKELKKKYLQKIHSLKKRVQYATNVLETATNQLHEFEAKRAKLINDRDRDR